MLKKEQILKQKQLEAMKAQSWKEKAIAEIKQAVRDSKKGIFLF